MSKVTGGPAFPSGMVKKSRPIHDSGADFVTTEVITPKHEGISMRDYFAAKALAVVPEQTAYNMEPKETHEAYVARRAYAIADAMLAERDK